MRKLISGLLALLMAACPCAFAAEVDEADLHLDCMTIIVGKDVSATGKVIVGHNEDDIGRYAVQHGYVPAADWPEGTYLPAENGRAAIPQAAHTFGYYWSEVRGAARGVSGADTFLNENGVCVCSNNNADSKENIFDDTRVTDGGLEYNMRRIIAERAESARHGLQVAIEMIETWGYAPSGRAYTIADANEAFMIQIVSGRRYIAARIPDNAVVCMPNHYTFHGLSDVEEMFYSEDLVEHAIEMNWYKPAVEGDYSDFDFAKAYQDIDSYMTQYNVPRQKYAMQILLDREWDVEAEGLPYAIYPETKISVEDIAEVLSAHYEDSELDERFGPGASPHDVGVRRICTGSTIEATIFEFADEPVLTTAWTAFGRPCQLPFMPLHPLAGTTDEIDVMEDPAKNMQEHLSYRANAVSYVDNGWQQLRNFENLQEMLYSDTINGVSWMLNSLHAQLSAQNEALVGEAANLIANGDMDAAIEALNIGDSEMTMDVLDALAEHTQAYFSIVNIQEADHPFSLSLPDMPYMLRFDCDGVPVQDSIYFGLAGLNVRTKYATALGLTDLGDGWYEIMLDPFTMMNNIEGGGDYDFILGGKTEDGRSFAGITVLEFVD